MLVTEVAMEAARRRMPGIYTAAELKADLAVHSIGTSAGVVAVIVLMEIMVRNHANPHFAAVLVYAVGLLSMLGFSAAYNLTRSSRWKEGLRRCDYKCHFPDDRRDLRGHEEFIWQ